MHSWLVLWLLQFGGSATVENILEFIDEGNDVLVAASPTLGEATREVLLRRKILPKAAFMETLMEAVVARLL